MPGASYLHCRPGGHPARASKLRLVVAARVGAGPKRRNHRQLIGPLGLQPAGRGLVDEGVLVDSLYLASACVCKATRHEPQPAVVMCPWAIAARGIRGRPALTILVRWRRSSETTSTTSTGVHVRIDARKLAGNMDKAVARAKWAIAIAKRCRATKRSHSGQYAS